MMIAFRYLLVSVVMTAAAVAAADEQGRAEKEGKLVALLKSDAPPSEKAMACKQLAVYGGKDAVPVLAPLLADPQLASWARIALEAIPDPAADAALREAMGKLKGRLLVGTINSIAVRRDAKAVEGLVKPLKDADIEVATAAAVALGRIGDDRAATILHETLKEGPASLRPAAAQGLVLCADKLLTSGNNAKAATLYDAIRKANVPKQRLLEATRGAILARGVKGVPLLVEQLRSSDKALFGIGLRTAREMPGREVAEALVAELGQAPANRQALLVLALADRSDAKAIGSAAKAVVEAAKSGPDNVRIAAIGVLGRLSNASCVPVLLEAALDESADVSQAAIDALADLQSAEVNDTVVARLAKGEGKGRLVMIQLAGRRRIPAAIPALIKAADDSDAQVRAAALAALGAAVEMNDLGVLMTRVASAKQTEDAKVAEAALRTACTRMADREACAEKLVAAMEGVPAPVKVKFLEVLTAMGGAKALQAVQAAAKDTSPEIQDAGTRLLGEWMTADAAPVLLDLAKSAPDARYKVRALRGYIRIARQINLRGGERLAMYREALPLCVRPEEKRLAVQVLSRVPTAESLSLAVAQLPAAKNEAGAAAVVIGKKLVATNPAAVAAAMKKVLEAGVPPKVTADAKALLEQASKK